MSSSLLEHVVPTPTTHNIPPADVCEKLRSDSSQLEAVQKALNQPVSIIQGPPGTGKTYVGVQIVRSFLSNDQQEARILCVCYTNHALDSFLESLLSSESIPDSSIIRFGNQNKMSERLKARCYQTIRGDLNKSSRLLKKALESEINYLQQQSHESINKLMKLLNDHPDRRFGLNSWKVVEEYLQDKEMNDIFSALTIIEEEGRTIIGKNGHKARKDYLWQQWVQGRPCPAAFTRQMVGLGDQPRIWEMTTECRQQHARRWFEDYVKWKLNSSILPCAKRLQAAVAHKAALYEQSKLEALQDIKIIGCTTTYAAQNFALIESLQPNILIVEEAAEILEANVLTCLMKSMNRLVMIGDHQQLRPKLNCYELTKASGVGLNFDISLFERLILSQKFPYTTLGRQHRMRPEISTLIRHTYPTLIDDEATKRRDNIRGMAMNVAFICHEMQEDISSNANTHENASKTNQFEVQMIIKMIKYLLQQGYSSVDIVILTPYLGQLMELRKEINKTRNFGSIISDRDAEELVAMGFEDEKDMPSSHVSTSNRIRVATIDNFQGEEAKIIIASLVRSNTGREIGFLKEAERVNVLLSRARDGLYLLGNIATFRDAHSIEGRKVWKIVLDKLEVQRAIVPGVPAYCATHKRLQFVRTPEEFETKVPEGGCDNDCSFEYACQYHHRCDKKCHPESVKHLQCDTKVRVLCERGMHEDFVKCSSLHQRRPCNRKYTHLCRFGHKQEMKCCDARNEPNCLECEIIAEKAKERAILHEQALLKEKMETGALELKASIEQKRINHQLSMNNEKLKQQRITEELALAKERSSKIVDSSRTTSMKPSSSMSSKSLQQRDCMSDNISPPSQSLLTFGTPGPSSASSLHQVLSTSDHEIAPTTASLKPSTSKLQRNIRRIIKAIADNEIMEAFDLIQADAQDLNVDTLSSASTVKWDPAIVSCYLLCCIETKSIDDAEALLTIFNELDRCPCSSSVLDMRDLITLKAYTGALANEECYPFRAAHHAEQYSPQNDIFPSAWKQKMDRVVANAPKAHPRKQISQSNHKISNDWEEAKRSSNRASPSIDTLMKMTGLEEIKASFVKLYNRVQMTKEQGKNLHVGNYNARFEGNPGTGKTTVAQLYCNLLIELTILPGKAKVFKCTGSELTHGGVSKLEQDLQDMKENGGGGVVFVDEAYQLDNSQGHCIVDFILGHAEALVGKFGVLVWVFAGYKTQMDKLFQHNMGLPSRFPERFNFEDYSDDELLSILVGLLERGGDEIIRPTQEKKDAAPPVVAQPLRSSLYSRSSPCTDRWGNVWRWNPSLYSYYDDFQNTTGYGVVNLGTVQNPLVDKNGGQWIYEDASNIWRLITDSRISQMTYPGKPIHHPAKRSPSFHLQNEKWARIAARRLGAQRGRNGFGNARAVRNLFDLAHSRQTQRISEQRMKGYTPDIYLFDRDDLLGPKPTRETLQRSTAWKQLDQLEGLQKVKESIKELFELVVDNAHREEEEKPLLEVALNKVFLGNPGTGKTTVATLYARILVDLGLLSKGEVHLKSSSDFIGSVVGSSEETTRRILEQAKGGVLVIDEAYGLGPSTSTTADPYREAVITTLVEQVQGSPGEDRVVLLLGYKKEMETMLRQCNPGLARRFQLEHAFHFEDYSDLELFRILIAKAKSSGLKIEPNVARFAVKQLARARAQPHFGNAGAVNNLLSAAKAKMMSRPTERDRLLKEDFAPNGYTEELGDIDELLASMVGCEEVLRKFRDMRRIAEHCRASGKDPKGLLEFTYLFTGSPGTGKTTIAKKLGTLFQSYNLIPSADVVECSASDLMTGYVGQTGKQTREIFSRARGKVLFIDEAYQLNPSKGGSFMAEAVDEIVKCLTHPDFQGNMIVILAGYPKEMEDMLTVNPGLRSRFTERIHFEDFTVDTIQNLIVKRHLLEDEASAILPLIASRLMNLKDFANARTIETFLKQLKRELIQSGAEDEVAAAHHLQSAMRAMEKTFGVNVGDHAPSRSPSLLQAPAPALTAQPAVPMDQSALNRVPRMVSELEKREFKSNDNTPSSTKDSNPNQNAGLMGALQTILDVHGYNNANGAMQLSSLDEQSAEFRTFVDELVKALGIDHQQASAFLLEWQGKHREVEDLLQKCEEKKRIAKAKKTKAQVPIWRCRVCGRADEPFIACYVDPYIVKYVECDV